MAGGLKCCAAHEGPHNTNMGNRLEEVARFLEAAPGPKYKATG